MWQELDNRLKSTAEKEQFQKKMASNPDEGEDAPKNIEIMLESH